MVDNFSDQTRLKESILVYGDGPDQIFRELSSLGFTVIVTMRIPDYSTLDITIYMREEELMYRVGMMVFFVGSYEELNLALTDVILHRIYNFRGVKTIIITKSHDEYDLIFYLLHWYNFIDSIIINIDNRDDIFYVQYTTYVFYSSDRQQYGCWSEKDRFELYSGKISNFTRCNNSCEYLDEEYFSEGAYYQKCLELTKQNFSKNVEVFPDKNKNLNGYPLFLLAVHTPPSLYVNESKTGMDMFDGKDAVFIKLLAERMNFTLGYRKALKQINDNPVFENIVSGFMDVSTSKYDISANIMYLTFYPFPSLDFSYPMEGGGLCFMTHKSGEVSMVQQNFKLFKLEVVLLTALAMMIISFLIQHTLKQHTKIQVLDRWGMAVSYVFRLFLSLPIPYRGHTDNIKFVMVVLTWCTFVIDYMMQSQMYYDFCSRPFEKDITTLKDLYHSGLPVHGFPSPDAFLPPTSEINIVLNDRFQPIDRMFTCADHLRNKKDIACWMECNLASDIARTYRDDSGKLSIHVGKERSHDFYLVYPFPKDSPLLNRVTFYTKRICESGLMKYWRESMLNAKPNEPPTTKPLTLDDFAGAFMSTGVYLLSGLCVFILEVIFGKINKRRALTIGKCMWNTFKRIIY